jgi:hypothetical protein
LISYYLNIIYYYFLLNRYTTIGTSTSANSKNYLV